MAAFNFRNFLFEIQYKTNNLASIPYLEANGCWYFPFGASESVHICWCTECKDRDKNPFVKRTFSLPECMTVYRSMMRARFINKAIRLKDHLDIEWRLLGIKKIRQKKFIEENKARGKKKKNKF